MSRTTTNDAKREQRIRERESAIALSSGRMAKLTELALCQPDLFERALQNEKKFLKYLQKQQVKDSACL